MYLCSDEDIQGAEGASRRQPYGSPPLANDNRQELIRALPLFSEQGLDIVDCILCAKAMSGPDHLFTFDAELNKIARNQ
jgi:predicted nucleic acid-binding protein